MTYKEALSYINSKLAFGSKPGLDRISKLLALLGNPQKALKCIHVAGTNGKGSCCAYISGALTMSGYKTGLFVSPFVYDFRERISIDGKMISVRDFAKITEKVIPTIESITDDRPTEFEIITAIALLYFKEKGCDAVVLETGLGGRFDATNIIENPICTVITSISKDHMQYLGNTLPEIAFEKAGIIKSGCPLVLYPDNRSDVTEVIRKVCKEKNAPFIFPSVSYRKIKGTGNTFVYDGITYNTRLYGEHQILNAITAINALYEIKARGFNISQKAIENGLSGAFMPARCEILSEKPLIILDGGHNEDGIKALTEFIKDTATGKVTAVFGVLQDKDYPEMIRRLCLVCNDIITVTPPGPRALPGENTAEYARKYIKSARFCRYYKTAIKSALSGSSPNDTVVICGSLYSAGKMKEAYRKIKKL